MTKKGTGDSEQGTGSVERLLRQALGPVHDDPEFDRDLWPAMLQHLEQHRKIQVPWFDWVLAGGLASLLFAFPAAIPVLLYYL